MGEDVEQLMGEAEQPQVDPFITLTLKDGGWSMDTNLQQGQAKWSICEIAAVFMAELKPKG